MQKLELADAKPGERTFDLTAQQIRHQRDFARGASGTGAGAS